MSDMKMPDLNEVTIAGRLTRDPELRYLTPKGGGEALAKCRGAIAVTERRKRGGQTTEETGYINFECWDKTAEWVGEKIAKGRPVMLQGKLKYESWTDKEGAKRTAVIVQAKRVQTLDWDGDGQGQQSAPPPPPPPRPAPAPRDIEEPFIDDDIPF